MFSSRFFMVACCLSLLCNDAFSNDLLKGIPKTLGVGLEQRDRGPKSKSVIATELRLRQSGFTVYNLNDEADFAKLQAVRAKALLFNRVEEVKAGGVGIGFRYCITLYGSARLFDSRVPINCCFYSTPGEYVFFRSQTREQLDRETSDALKASVDHFLNDYLKANPAERE